MNLIGKPKNRWGWVRIAGLGLLALMIVWTILAAAFTWWSGYKVYSLLDRFELAVVPLLAVFIAGWLEDHDHRAETEHAQRRADEHAAALQRKETLNRVQAAVLAVLAEGHQEIAGIAETARVRIVEVTLAALADLDGKGRGEMLHFLYDQGLLNGAYDSLPLPGPDFSGAVLQKAQLKGLCLREANLAAAQLDGAHLYQARLPGANLKKAFLRHADLREAELTGCNLTRAHLEHANLASADLTGAVLDGAFLAHANLHGCNLRSIEMLDTAVLIETTLPDGTKVTNEKGKEYLRKKEIAALVDRL